MNWTRSLIRFSLAFVVLYGLGYIIPGFSGLTIPLLALIGAFIALVSALIEHSADFSSNRNRAFILFLSTGAIIYILSFTFVGRPPVASAIFAAILVALVEFAFSKPVRKEKKMLS